MRNLIRSFDVITAPPGVSPRGFVSEVAQFRATLADPALSIPQKARAWDKIVRLAVMLDPHEAGFERAGVALKEALCLWLDVRSAPVHH